jgi:hypothetical protein
MYYYNNISFKELLKIISTIPIISPINENNILEPFKRYRNLWDSIPNKKDILHFWSILTEHCKNTFIPHPYDAIKLLIFINLNKDTKHKCFLYLDDNKKIDCLSIIYLSSFENRNLENTLEQYLMRMPLFNSLFKFGLNLNIDTSYWRFVHSNLMIVNNINMYGHMLNDIYKSLCSQEQIFGQEPYYKGIIITKYISSHPHDEEYHKNVIKFNTDANLKDENDVQLYFKII